MWNMFLETNIKALLTVHAPIAHNETSSKSSLYHIQQFYTSISRIPLYKVH